MTYFKSLNLNNATVNFKLNGIKWFLVDIETPSNSFGFGISIKGCFTLDNRSGLKKHFSFVRN